MKKTVFEIVPCDLIIQQQLGMLYNMRKIVWEKWRCPYGGDSVEAEWPGAFGTPETDELVSAVQDGERRYPFEEYEFDEEDIEKGQEELKRREVMEGKEKKMGMLSTPMGIVPVNEFTSAHSLFNFWTMHTNFRINRTILRIIDNTDGVESFDYFTPYRWRIAIGKTFNSVEVKERVAKNLNAKSVKLNE